MRMPLESDLLGQRVIVVEDEWLLARQLAGAFQRAGAEVVGMAPTIDRALTLIESSGSLDAAVLDLDLKGSLAVPVADALEQRGVPFIWATAYDGKQIPQKYRSKVLCRKPATANEIIDTIARLLYLRSRDKQCDISKDVQERSNRLLAELPARSKELIEPHLETVELSSRKSLERSNRSVDQCYFIDSGVASLIARSTRRGCIEVGMIGSEGMTGAIAVLDDRPSFCETVMQLEGSGRRIPALRLRELAAKDPVLDHSLRHYATGLIRQMSTSVLAAGRFQTKERLARWLLMMHDRVEDDIIPMPHDAIAFSLGVRRASVTVAVHELEEKGLVLARRGQIIVNNRAGLIEFARGCYAPAECEDQRLSA